MSWEVAEGSQLTLAGGLNQQAPSGDEGSKTFGNPDLVPERAAYVSMGYRQEIGGALAIDIQGFYKHLFDLISPTDAPFGSDEPRYNNGGVGYVLGGEFLAQWNMAWFDGWVSYISTSRRTDQPGGGAPLQLRPDPCLGRRRGGQASLGLAHRWTLPLRVGQPLYTLEPGYYDATATFTSPNPPGPLKWTGR